MSYFILSNVLYLSAITQALGCGKKDGSKTPHGPVMSCEHCPLVWYHKLCHEVEVCSPDISAQVCIYCLKL